MENSQDQGGIKLGRGPWVTATIDMLPVIQNHFLSLLESSVKPVLKCGALITLFDLLESTP